MTEVKVDLVVNNLGEPKRKVDSFSLDVDSQESVNNFLDYVRRFETSPEFKLVIEY